ncbi:MAG TPA: energy transducer TonB [Vicinamibacterales bacterium]|nr:energy transducer TonB [Vicinamibacterales bacterium]
MFDLVTGEARHIPNHNAVPLLISSIVEGAALAVVVAVPLLFLAGQVPEVPSMMAFVAAAPPPAPPPPPPAPRAAVAAQAKPAVAPTTAATAPLEAPSEIKTESPAAIDVGVPGGVEGGVPGGVVGGVLGTFVEAPPPPPPPAAPAPVRPVRIAGAMKAPVLVKRVEPEYPPLAVAARISGIVILEATVDAQGLVSDVRVLRSVNPIVDAEAVRAVKQWRYSPLTLNGHLSPFILTVTLSFSVK